jgi:AhpD family alkylhydroperoxidase
MTDLESPPTRVNVVAGLPAAYSLLADLHQTVSDAITSCGLDEGLVELIRLRVSQINGCVLCTDMHTGRARRLDVAEQRIDLLPVWRDAPCFGDVERAALELAEAVTLLAEGHVPEHIYRQVSHRLTERQLAVITWVVVVINAYNRIAVTSRLSVPAQQPC